MTALRITLLSACAALLGACDNSTHESSTHSASPVVQGDTTPSGGGDAWPETLRFGLVPSEGGSDTLATWEPILERLEERVGIPIEAFTASDYIGVITAMENDKIDAAYFGPKSYVEASTKADAEAIIKELDVDGNPGYFSIFVVPADSPAQSLADLRGKSCAFVTRSSTSGWLIPASTIFESFSESPDSYFGEVRFAGNHGSVMNLAALGEIDCGATNTLDLTAMAAAGKVDAARIREIARSPLIPGAPVAVRRELPQSLKDAIREGMLAMNDDADLLAKASRGGFVETNDAEYDPIRLATQRLNQYEHAEP